MAAATHEIPELDARGLRHFALTTGAIVAVLFGLFFPWLLEFGIPTWPWALAAILAAWGLAAPRSLRPVYRGWMRFGLLLNRVVSPLVLSVVFFVLIVPLAVGMRIAGRDTLSRKLDRTSDTYRVPSRRQAPDKMEKPF